MNAAEPEERRVLARRLWQHVEAVHAVVYFAPEVAERAGAAQPPSAATGRTRPAP